MYIAHPPNLPPLHTQDKTNGYDFFYRQNVIKPALVGLAGPWISGGVEFNWPQHHRPSTFMPVDIEVERGEDGSVTVWCSEHEPMQRMKGMHGVCLRPDRCVCLVWGWVGGWMGVCMKYLRVCVVVKDMAQDAFDDVGIARWYCMYHHVTQHTNQPILHNTHTPPPTPHAQCLP